MIKFELPRGIVARIGVYCLILIAGLVFNNPYLRNVGAGTLVGALLIVFFTARQ